MKSPADAPTQTRFPIPLNDAQEAIVKEWAADDRLWTTQETVEFNLRTFARVILGLRWPNEDDALLTLQRQVEVEKVLQQIRDIQVPSSLDDVKPVVIEVLARLVKAAALIP